MRTSTGILALLPFTLGALAAPALGQELRLEPLGAKDAKLGYFPIQVPLTTQKPAGITKEPAYRTTPKYGVIHVGNGPNSTYYLALDEPPSGDWKIYFDKNRNGDLTDDGDGAWSKKSERGGRTMYGLNEYIVRASWGTPTRETSSGDYGLAFYRFTNLPALLMFREAAREGTVTVDGKPHKALLADNDADALYSKPLDDEGRPEGGGKPGRPIWLIVDLADQGKFDAHEAVDARSPFKLGDTAYVAKIAQDGSTIVIQPTTRKVAERKEPQRPKLLAAGTVAPDFAVEGQDGHTVHLADLRGKVVILDFWATWCGPCQASMPHLERVFQRVKNKGVTVLAVCTWDEKPAYTEWIPQNKAKYTFPLAFDPAGRDAEKSVAAHLYNVSGIPTTYVIDKDGKVIDAVLGYDGENDTRIEAALAKAGIQIASAKQPWAHHQAVNRLLE